MTKFNYKKWVTENKHGKIKEQIGDDTIGDDFVVGGNTCYICVSSSQAVNDLNNAGGLQQNGSAIVLGMNEFPVSNAEYAPQCYTSYPDIVAGSTSVTNFAGFLTSDMSALPDYAYNTPNSEVCFEQSTTSTPGGAYVDADNPPDSYLGTGDPNNPVQSDFDFNTDCTNFNNLPQDFQDLICNQCDNQPGYIDMNCECCNQGQGQPSSTSGVGVNTSPPGMTSGGSSSTTSGQMAPNKKKQKPMKKKPSAPSQPIDLKRTIREVINKLKKRK